jgi:hypothetical protein
MSAMTDYLENKLVDHMMRAVPYTAPAALYVALFTTATTDAGGGTEVLGGAYARVQCGPSLVAWKGTHGSTSGNSSGTGGVTSNASPVSFPLPTADWGSIGWYAIFDALSGGNMLFQGPLQSAKTVNLGDPAPSFLADQLVLTYA